MPAIAHLFGRADCRHCLRAKQLLDEAKIAYLEHDVAASPQLADASIYLSGAATVPQLFIGDLHIQGADDLEALHASGHLPTLVERAATRPFAVPELDAAGLAEAARDLPLREVIAMVDLTRTSDPESWLILRFYRQFFGFWPNTFAYLARWPEAYKAFVYCQNLAAIEDGQTLLGPSGIIATAFATSEAHGCSYCQTHAVATLGETSAGLVDLYRRARAGDREGTAKMGAFELALGELAAAATRNRVTSEQLAAVRAATPAGRSADAVVNTVELMVASFGFLNTFNDLTAVAIEGDWAQLGQQTGVESGRHAVDARNPANLEHELPSGGPSLAELKAGYERVIGDDPEAYARGELGLVPGWIARWPAAQRRLHLYLYTELMAERSHARVSAELKHLMSRVSAIVRDHGALAADEAMMAAHAGGGEARAVERVRWAYAAALGRDESSEWFRPRERAALRLAWLSAQLPLITPRRFVAELIDCYDADELVELCAVCSLAALVQRQCAIAKPASSTAARSFAREHGLELDPLALRYGPEVLR